MQLNTKHFGEVDYSEDNVIVFEEGLVGFGEYTRFLLLADDPDDLFHWLQSTEDEDLAFVLMDIKQIKPDYEPTFEQELIESPISYYVIAVVPEVMEDMRVNLKAPILINKNIRKGKQVIAENKEYGVRHYIFKESQVI